MTLHFISDLHLDQTRPLVAESFRRFLASVPRPGDSLYILGDLFEVWLGDDDKTDFNTGIVEALDQARQRGIHTHVMHGNRDFLLGRDFCAAAGADLLPEPTLIDCFGRRALLLHGDSLCTRDLEYLKVRAQLRNPAFQQEFLARSLTDRAAFAANARMESKQHTANTAMAIMDVTPEEVIRVMSEHGVDLLIHGHTHRPMVHRVALEGRQGTRIVLGDWAEQGWQLRFDAGGYHLLSFPIAAAQHRA